MVQMERFISILFALPNGDCPPDLLIRDALILAECNFQIGDKYYRAIIDGKEVIFDVSTDLSKMLIEIFEDYMIG